MVSTTNTLYETDFAEWADHTADLIRARRFDELDIENLAEEVQDLGESVRRSVRAQLKRLMMHKLKQQLQPERASKSWQASIDGAREKILDDLEDIHSLRDHLLGNMDRVYKRALAQASRETGKSGEDLPDKCPWSLDDLLS